MLALFVDLNIPKTAAGMTAALPFMVLEIKELAERTLEKLNELTEEEFAGITFEPAKE